MVVKDRDQLLRYTVFLQREGSERARMLLLYSKLKCIISSTDCKTPVTYKILFNRRNQKTSFLGNLCGSQKLETAILLASESDVFVPIVHCT